MLALWDEFICIMAYQCLNVFLGKGDGLDRQQDQAHSDFESPKSHRSRSRDADRDSGARVDTNGKEVACFRPPRGRVPHQRGRGRYNRVPDHGKRPDNVTYYNLEDVSRSDMSDRLVTFLSVNFS